MTTVIADDLRRVQIPGIKPGQVFACEMAGNVVKLTPVKLGEAEADVPVVQTVKGPNGLYRLPEGVKLTRESIRAAIRADRDAQ